jgi:YaiO family outer membrane protein
VWPALAIAFFAIAALAQDRATGDWEARLRASVTAHDYRAALGIADARLREVADDREAQLWHARLLSWVGEWQQAEAEYRLVLEREPANFDALLGLCDVLSWQQRFADALAVLPQAEQAHPPNSEILRRKAALLAAGGRRDEARQAYRALLALEPHDAAATRQLDDLRLRRFSLNFGSALETTPSPYLAQEQSAELRYRFTSKLRAGASIAQFQRFGVHGQSFHFIADAKAAARDSFSVSLGGATEQAVVPRRDVALSYSHLIFRGSGFIRGFETGTAAQGLWYLGAQAKTLRSVSTLYLPRDVEVGVTAGTTRASIGTGPDWSPAAMVRFAFPARHSLRASVSFGTGADTYVAVGRTLELPARSFGAGLRYAFIRYHFLQFSISSEALAQHTSRTLVGFRYGISF